MASTESETTASSDITLTEDVLSDPEELDESEDSFKLVMPVLMKFGNLTSCHSTKDFYLYLNYLQELETSSRRGQRYRNGDENDRSNLMNEATMSNTQKVAEVESGVPNTTVNLA